MAQLNFTLDYDFLVGLFSESKDEAFGKLMEALLNQILKTESAVQLGAEDYERTNQRSDYRNGSRIRPLMTRIGKIELEVPRHRNKPFKSMLFENYQRNEQALIATMMEMVVQGVSTRKVQKVTEELCGERFSKSTVSEICRELDVPVRNFRSRLLSGKYPFVIVDAMYIKVRENHRVISKAFMIAVGVNASGHKEVLGFDLHDTEKESSWRDFFESLKSRGLNEVDLIVSDDCPGLVKAIRQCYPGASWQRCQVHFTKNIIDKTPLKYQEGLRAELRTVFQANTIEEARRLRNELCDEYADVAENAVRIFDDGFEDVMTVMALPPKYRISLRTSNIIERLNREVRRREKVIQIFPNANSSIRLLGALLEDIHNDWIVGQRLFNMNEYHEKFDEIRQKILKLKSA